MDLDRLTLSPSQVAQWYAKSLVVVPGARPRARRPEREGVPAQVSAAPAASGGATPATPAPLKYLGENEQHILILVRDTSAVFLEEKAFQFLLSVLEACKLSMASVALVNLENEARTPEAIAAELGSTQVILFGVGIEELGLPMLFPAYQVQPHGNRTYLAADALATIAGERTLKGRLWACLKSMFQR
ncbi:hypothetical protein [Dinghuibacter silviterrae]|uniref:Uncharacterized protein n=1 Tax=Dinghuibacter silviterrae TaxID=1539049 RepID=A0A4R8DR57_9BACT|nr:hypothetical protein [Dinghuibacter silviterrae]TDX00660.1 hypothetical protein EDB95_1686 [Dinghuibacter silviterrae]